MKLRKGDRVIATRRVGSFVRGYVEQGTPGVVVDERSFFGFGTTYEVAFDVGGRVDRRDGLDDHDIAPV
jgi:hypothetical protein